jgi:SsrA-binding protein
MPTLAVNKRAKFDYSIVEEIEAGIELAGFEVKAVRAKRAQLLGSFIHERGGEIFLVNAQIPALQPKNTPEEYDERRSRRLLLRRREIDSLAQKLKAERLTAIPLELYTKGRLIKVKLGLARSKKQHDKRETIKRRESDREIGRQMRNRP